MNVTDLRRDYASIGLTDADAGADPLDLFDRWFHDALKAQAPEPNAMTLATASPTGLPAARIVLLKAFDHQGFSFFTNLNSHKSRDLLANPHAALVFHWHICERQVRIEGRVERTTDAESDEYFAKRPRGSQLGAWASPQSAVIPDRATLERAVAEVEAKYPGAVPRPPHWGGFRVVPAVIEFWQGRPSRLHDRLRYTRQADNSWLRERLGP